MGETARVEKVISSCGHSSPLGTGIDMHCSCGFTELADEDMTDHLLAAFTPAGSRGNDGLVHEEGDCLTCFCG